MPLLNLKKQDTGTGFTLDSNINWINFLKSGQGYEYVSADEALHNSDIFSLIMQLSGDLAMVRYTAESSHAQTILNNPSDTANGFSFWQGMFAQLLLDGNAYAYRHKNANGVDLTWEYLRPSQVQTMLLEDGSGLIYNVNFDEPDLGFVSNIPSTDMIHSDY